MVDYDAGDPFVVHERDKPLLQPGMTLTTVSAVITTIPNQVNSMSGVWVPIGNREECGEESLLTFLANRVEMDEGVTEGAVRLLDGKGLASASPNLKRRDCKVLKWEESSSGYVGYHSPVTTSVNSTLTFNSSKVEPTPLEASRTKFGEDFLHFYRP
jgi:hypothetical protein